MNRVKCVNGEMDRETEFTARAYIVIKNPVERENRLYKIVHSGL
jgi:hypothetical protein